MAKRRKKLKQRVLTYDEITSRISRAKKKDSKSRMCGAVLYGSVTAQVTALNANFYEIGWWGNLRRAGGPDKSERVAFARVFRLSDGDTGYVVMPISRARKNNKRDAARLKVWKRYVGVFTPHDPSHRLFNLAVGYRIRNGVATRCEVENDTMAHPFPAGCWQSLTPVNRPAVSYWAGGGFTPGQPDKVPYGLYPKFIARCRRFHSDLKKQLADGPQAVVQLLHKSEVTGRIAMGNSLHVCLPPTRTKHGRRLIVSALMHNDESRRFFHIDGDYSPRHSQYFALDVMRPGELMRWKCGKEALVGIKEWVLGSIYIPGPE